MVTARAKNKLIDEINSAFSSIGKKIPKTSNNREPYAWEFFVSSHLQRMAKARRDEAMMLAIKEGVLFDTDEPSNQRPPGTQEAVFTGTLVSVMLSVAKPRVLINNALLRTYLADHGVSERILDEAFNHASKESKPGHQFTAALIVNGDTNGK